VRTHLFDTVAEPIVQTLQPTGPTRGEY